MPKYGIQTIISKRLLNSVKRRHLPFINKMLNLSVKGRPLALRSAVILLECQRYGFKQNPDVSADGPVVDVLTVQADDFIEFLDVGPSGHLPEAGHSGFHAEPSLVKTVVLIEFTDCRRAGSDKGHVAFEDIPELRKFVKARLADEMADLCDTRVILHLEHEPVHFILCKKFRLPLFRILIHAAELVHAELAAIFSDPRLREDDRPGRVEFDKRSENYKEYATDRKAHDRTDDVDRALHD